MTQGKLAGKSAIVTGAGRGIGAAIGRRFVKEGANVLINFNRSSTTAVQLSESLSLEGPGRAIAHQADVSKIPDIKTMVFTALKEFGKIDILVNNAGVLFRRDFHNTTEQEYDQVMAVNLKGPYFCCLEVAPIMQNQKGGTIINISSISGLVQPTALAFPDYVASKAGILGLTRALAVNLAPDIRVNAVCPGLMDTDMTKAIAPEARQRLMNESFVKRVGRPEEIASACLFLASDESDFITGEFLTVGGGRAMR